MMLFNANATFIELTSPSQKFLTTPNNRQIGAKPMSQLNLRRFLAPNPHFEILLLFKYLPIHFS